MNSFTRFNNNEHDLNPNIDFKLADNFLNVSKEISISVGVDKVFLARTKFRLQKLNSLLHKKSSK